MEKNAGKKDNLIRISNIEKKINDLNEFIDSLRDDFMLNGKISEDSFNAIFKNNQFKRSFLKDLLNYELEIQNTKDHRQYYFTFSVAVNNYDNNIMNIINSFKFPELNLEPSESFDRISMKINQIQSCNIYPLIGNENEYQKELKDIFLLSKNEEINKIINEIIKNVDDYESMIFSFFFLIRFLLKFQTRIQILKNKEHYFLFFDLTTTKENFYYLSKKNHLNLQIKFFERSENFEDILKNKKEKRLKMKENDFDYLDDYSNDKPDFYTPHLPFSEKNEKFFLLYTKINDKIHLCDYCFSFKKSFLNKKKMSENGLIPDYELCGCYDDNNLSILRNIDKKRLILRSLRKLININKINNRNRQNKLFQGAFIMHNYDYFEKKIFCITNIYVKFQYPIRTKKVNLMNRKFRNFYGENVGFYFIWLSHYIQWLFLPVIICCIYYCLSALLLFFFEENKIIISISYIVKFIFSLFLMFWGNTYIQSWMATQKFIIHSWGMDYNKYEEYNHITNIKTRNYLDIKIPIESNFHYYVIRLFSFLVIVIFILVSIMVNLGIFYIQSLYLYLTELNNQSLTNAVNKNWPYISSIIIYIFREILSYIFCKVLPYITECENHLTKKSKNNSIVVKSIIFQFFNYYFIFYYIAFIKKYYFKCAYDCYEELSITIKMILLLHILGDILDLFILIYFKNKYDTVKENAEIKIEKQSKQENFIKCKNYLFLIKIPYEGDSINTEYITIIMNYGYIIQFGSISPVCFLLALIQAMLYRIFDAIKFGNLIYLGFIYESQGIEIFSNILKIFTFFGFTSSIMINLFTNVDNQYAMFDNTIKWILAFCFENICVFVLFFWKLDLLPLWFHYRDKIRMTIENKINYQFDKFN